MKNFFREWNAFYPVYLQAHDNTGNRALHFIGSTLFFALMALAILLPAYWLIPVAIFTGYLLPGIGHRFFQHNKSFRASKPVLCVLCAFRLYVDMLTFRLPKRAE